MDVLIKTALISDIQMDFMLPLQFGYSKSKNEEILSADELSDLQNTSNNSVNDEYHSTQLSSESEDAMSSALLEEQRIEKLITKTKEEAYKEGYAESISDVQVRYSEQFEKIDSLIKSINEALPIYIKKNEPVIASIVFESVCKIIGEELANKSKSILVVEKTINSVEKDRIREILISQDDFNAIESLNSDLSSDGVVLEGNINKFIFKVDPTIKFGGCKIKLIDGYMDASIDGQLKALSKSLKAKVDDLVE